MLQIDADVHFHKNFDELFEIGGTLSWTKGATWPDGEKINGGYLRVTPNLDHYKRMVDVILEGDFRDGSGWKGTHNGWCYGGRTIQGILPYFYFEEEKKAHVEVERCKYNNMVEIERCKAWVYEDVTSNHFTVCQKPFTCTGAPVTELCHAFTEKWWKRTREIEKKLGLDKRPRCQGSRYTPMDYSRAKNKDAVVFTPT